MENYYQNVQGNDQKVLSVKERIQNLNKENSNNIPSNSQSSKYKENNTNLNHSNFSYKHEGYQNVNLAKTFNNNASLNSTNFLYKNGSSKNKSPAKNDGEFLFNSYTYVDLSGKSEQEKVDSLKNCRAPNTVVNSNRNKNSRENSQPKNFHKFENMQEVHSLLERKYWWKNCKFVFVFIVLMLSILIITVILLVSH